MQNKALPSISEVSKADGEKTPASVKALVLSLVSRVENEVRKEKLQRNIQNSSQPPSEDKPKGFKAKKPRSRRPRGGQPGQAGNAPKLYPPEAREHIENYYPSQ
ncbi:DUF6444 domain-containing protein [Leptothoe sp. PORK10 BA2]|uniref:DUF6444 domain-containing protein n=1 Tax=Leptothoe sp. PORK10 BA2 TaxID=3110254 RepID=UPI002B1F7A2A|nr:DUF6444 domain-containing protein [Leptothoe sp. PORK10 BA2]MEA5462312.1 DUF6444 domain-containing protein [Leptothoe sp. PORK10 BA2]